MKESTKSDIKTFLKRTLQTIGWIALVVILVNVFPNAYILWIYLGYGFLAILLSDTEQGIPEGYWILGVFGIPFFIIAGGVANAFIGS